MNKLELLEILHACDKDDEEEGHRRADNALLKFIDDPEITTAFNHLHKWYA